MGYMLIYNEAEYLSAMMTLLTPAGVNTRQKGTPKQHNQGIFSNHLIFSKIVMGIHTAVSYARQLTRSA